MAAPTTKPIITLPKTLILDTSREPTPKKFIVMSSGNIRVMIKYEAMAVITMELQLPIFSAFWISCSLASLLLILIKKLPNIENKIPTPAITKGNNIVPIPPKSSLMAPPISRIT